MDDCESRKFKAAIVGFSLDCKGAGQLQYGLVRDNIITEIKDPLVVDKSVKKSAFELEQDADPEMRKTSIV